MIVLELQNEIRFSSTLPLHSWSRGNEMLVRWMENTASDIEEVISRDPIVIVPVGSVEQHGKHLPTGCDVMVAELVALKAAEDCEGKPPVLVLPAIWHGFSPHHMSFPGTMTLRSETLISVICEVCESILQQGVRRVVILNGHGGNISSIDVAVARLGEAWGGHGCVAAVTYWNLVAHRIDEFRESAPGGTGHAGEFESSLMLATHEDLVHMDKAVTHYPQLLSPVLTTDLFENPKARIYSDFKSLSPSGTLGDPSLATKSKGERILKACVGELIALLKDFATWPIERFVE